MTSNSPQPLIELQNASAHRSQRLVLEKIELKIMPADFLALIGPNGGGKTTLFECLLGLHSLSGGSIHYHADLLKRPDRGLGYVPQQSQVDLQYPISVREVVLAGRLLGPSIARRFNSADESALQSVLGLLELELMQKRAFRDLSGGERQRVLIARALCAEPRVLLLDEPTAHLDPSIIKNFYKLLRKLNQHITIVLATHDTGALAREVKSVACLNRKLHYHGDPELDADLLGEVYGCDIELIAHGVPHRVLAKHD